MFFGMTKEMIRQDRASARFLACLRKIRLSRAERLLKKSEMSVEEIADAVGYQNRGFFYRIFREEYGCTPARYRERASAM